ncbi:MULTISPECIES: hypothetical protein [unclassified Bradyrhizobium]|uniref:preATP grasp domain-containing protein n=1 Tax=unclassified Bradyrhizobium TaxID=2631580 RepID=UPI0028E8BE13|nr:MULTISPECIES: hypothetical protein [unclassified Bradyrhizobium]
MRLIIANDLDDWIVRKTDIRAWSQRMLWFAEQNDVVVSMCSPDPEFVQYVGELKGIDSTTWSFHTPPNNRFGGKMFDHMSLMDPEFVSSIAKDATRATDVLVSWPSPLVAQFVDRIGVSDRWPGYPVFAQAASELFNSKAAFRVFAAGNDVPIAHGTVCRSIDAAAYATSNLLTSNGAAVIKKALGSAGAGNHILTTETDLDVGGAGCKYLSVIENRSASILEFWREHWAWASSSGAYPVVVEAFQRGARTIYAEYECADDGVCLGCIGELKFSDRSPIGDTVPVVDLGPDERRILLDESLKLANAYWKLGYRGPLSADAIVATDGAVTFTEVNAQVTGSTHVYRILLRLAGAGRKVSQVFSPQNWMIESTSQFMSMIRRLGCAYDATSRRGIIVTTPRIGSERTGPIAFATVYERPDEREDMLRALQNEFDA